MAAKIGDMQEGRNRSTGEYAEGWLQLQCPRGGAVHSSAVNQTGDSGEHV